jgi:hypothetical protein
MPLVVKDRVQETTTTTGTGTLTLDGAVVGFQTFSSAIGNGNTTYYAIFTSGGSEWEVGIGTVAAGTLARTTVLESSNAGSLVNLSAGTKNVICTYPAEKSVDLDTDQTLSNKSISGLSNTLTNVLKVSSTAPTSPNDSDLWYDQVSGETFIYYNDGTSSQWVSAAVRNEAERVAYVGSASGVTSATLPLHQTGDLILAYAYRDGSTTAPTLPSGWTSIASANGANTNSALLAYKVAASGSETATGFTNATALIVQIYRNVDQSSPIGGNNFDTGSSTTISYPEVTMSVTNGTSWVVGFSGHRSTNVAIQNSPAGMSNRIAYADATNEAASFDTAMGVTSWSAQTASVGGTASGWFARTVEIKQTPVASLNFPSSPTTGQLYRDYIWDGVKWASQAFNGALAGGVIFENGQVIYSNYTIGLGKNALSAGDIAISSGVTVTVPSGSRWVIV